MRIAFTITAAALVLAAGPQGTAAAGPHGEHVRYVSVKACTVREMSTPCGPWRLVTHSGAIKPLKDAQVTALYANGKPSENTAPIAVSGDGGTLAYFRKKDGRLAIRDAAGHVKLMPKTALPRRTHQFNVTFELSNDGRRLAAIVAGEKRATTLLYDTVSGITLGALPGDESFTGFSGDGGEVMTSVGAEETTTELRVYDDTGRFLLTRVPPQIIANNGVQALSPDGETVAVLVASRKPLLVLYNLRTDEIVAKHRIKLPAVYGVDRVAWTGEEQVTAHLTHGGSGATKMRIVQFDAANGRSRTRDSYTVLRDSYSFAACGG